MVSSFYFCFPSIPNYIPFWAKIPISFSTKGITFVTFSERLCTWAQKLSWESPISVSNLFTAFQVYIYSSLHLPLYMGLWSFWLWQWALSLSNLLKDYTNMQPLRSDCISPNLNYLSVHYLLQYFSAGFSHSGLDWIVLLTIQPKISLYLILSWCSFCDLLRHKQKANFYNQISTCFNFHKTISVQVYHIVVDLNFMRASFFS